MSDRSAAAGASPTPPTTRVVETVQATAQGAAQAAHQVADTAQTAAHQAAETAHLAAETAREVTASAQVAARRATVPVRAARRRGRVFLWIALGALAAFAGLAIIIHGHHQNSIDLRITHLVQAQQRRRPRLERLMRWISRPGFAPWSWLIPVGTAGVLRWLGYRLEARFMLATGLANGLVSAIKLVIARPRPSHPSIVVAAALKDYSFPSGHTIQYAAQFGYVTYLAYALLRPGWPRRTILSAGTSLIALVGPSRIGMGQHWASDVLASYCLGTAFLIGHIGLYRRLKDRQSPVARGTSQTAPVPTPPGARRNPLA